MAPEGEKRPIVVKLETLFIKHHPFFFFVRMGGVLIVLPSFFYATRTCLLHPRPPVVA